MARVADHVYDHILAVCRDPTAARTSAVSALGRAPRSLPAALGHSRSFAIGAARVAPDGGRPPGDSVADGLLELTWLLAATRPVDERSVVDLATRHGLDRAGLGRAMATSPAAAGAEAETVLERWDADLRPALLAFLGPGECPGLRDVLQRAGLAATSPPSPSPDDDAAGAGTATEATTPVTPTLDALLSVAPAVAHHVAECDVCPDRVRAMASVRSLLAQVPITVAPPSLQPAGSRWRRSAEPVEPGAGDRRPRHRRMVAMAAAIVAVLLVAGAVTVAITLGQNDDDQVAVLTRVPARNALAAVPDEIEPGQAFLLESTADHAVRWHIPAGEPWVHTQPSSGVLRPRHTTDVRVRLDSEAPEGDLRVDLTVAGDDGSAILVRLRGSVEHAPALAATADGCTVTAQVEDESDVASVELHWRSLDGVDDSRTMAKADDGYRAAIPATAVPARWWISAADGRGNRARSAETALTAC